jgi:hypothetical protein
MIKSNQIPKLIQIHLNPTKLIPISQNQIPNHIKTIKHPNKKKGKRKTQFVR